ncbi:hypothetical protein DA803_00645 [[Mycoplasma] phocae]|uniref:Lipoprotein n=1 Tax=[Mycoplasma] phocae TaxID=142651 RepID=A0A2Z5IQ75_9BACT|nr:hypothetical protein [[Mycoplasma] phocae]AXE60604.1 hypothetical protein DA803_00645 [[Mycoplasma] phocae]
MKKKNFKWWIALPGVIFTLPLVAAACGNTNNKEMDRKPDQGNGQMDENKKPDNGNNQMNNENKPDQGNGQMNGNKKPDNGNNQMNDGKKPDQEKDKMDGNNKPDQNNGQMDDNKIPKPTPPEKKNDLEKYSDEIIYLNLYVLNFIKIGEFLMDQNEEKLLKVLNNSKSILTDLLDKKIKDKKEINLGLQLIDSMTDNLAKGTIKNFIQQDYVQSLRDSNGQYSNYLKLVSAKFSNFALDFKGSTKNINLLLEYWKKLNEESKNSISYKTIIFLEYLLSEIKNNKNKDIVDKILPIVMESIDKKTELDATKIKQIDEEIKKLNQAK